MSSDTHTVFHFKQFDVANNRSAMRVNTDGVLLGAWADVNDAGTIWDAGCGTGLISLMMAQKNTQAKIIGIEIDPIAALESIDNFSRSPWGNRLEVVTGDILDAYHKLPSPDVIICNPPFFNEGPESLKSPDARRCMARHATSLSCESIVEIAGKVLPDNGSLFIVAPCSKSGAIEQSITLNRLHARGIVTVSTTARKAPKRTLWHITRKECLTADESLVIHLPGGEFSPEYKQLVSAFYLNM